MKNFENPEIKIIGLSLEDIVTESSGPQRKSAYLAAMGNLESQGILEAEIDVFGFEGDPNRN